MKLTKVLLCVLLLATTVITESMYCSCGVMYCVQVRISSRVLEISFDATLEGAQQTPPVTTLGAGSATFTLDVESRKLTWDISYEFLDSGVTMAHIHGPAELEENGGVLIDLEPSVYVNI